MNMLDPDSRNSPPNFKLIDLWPQKRKKVCFCLVQHLFCYFSWQVEYHQNIRAPTLAQYSHLHRLNVESRDMQEIPTASLPGQLPQTAIQPPLSSPLSIFASTVLSSPLHQRRPSFAHLDFTTAMPNARRSFPTLVAGCSIQVCYCKLSRKLRIRGRPR